MIETEAKLIAEETDKYVRSGQRSIVEKYLVAAQAKEAETRTAEIFSRIKMVEARLRILLGVQVEQSLQCKKIDQVENEIENLEKGMTQSPLLQVGQVRSQVTRHHYDQAKADSNPILVGLASGEYFHNPHLNVPWNYAAGVGITFPLFDGFKRSAQADRFSAEMSSQESALEYAKQSVEESNSKLDEQTDAAKVKLDYLEKETTLAKKAFDLAKKRYFSLQGTMVDLREALRNLDRVESSIQETRRTLLASRGERALFNGAKP